MLPRKSLDTVGSRQRQKRLRQAFDKQNEINTIQIVESIRNDPRCSRISTNFVENNLTHAR